MCGREKEQDCVFMGCRECLLTGGLTMGRLDSELSFSPEEP